MALIVTFGVTGLLTVLGRDDGSGGPAMVARPTEQAQTMTPVPVEETDPPLAAASPTPPAPTPQEATESQIDNVTVQVLDAVGTGTQAEAAADALRSLGYDVVVVNETPRRVDTTTVLATPGHADDAKALRAADPRFAVIKRNADFNQSVDLHVLVGPDFDG